MTVERAEWEHAVWQMKLRTRLRSCSTRRFTALHRRTTLFAGQQLPDGSWSPSTSGPRAVRRSQIFRFGFAVTMGHAWDAQLRYRDRDDKGHAPPSGRRLASPMVDVSQVKNRSRVGPNARICRRARSPERARLPADRLRCLFVSAVSLDRSGHAGTGGGSNVGPMPPPGRPRAKRPRWVGSGT